MGQSLNSDNIVRPGLLPFVKPLRFRTVAQGKMGRFNKRPGQVLVAVLGIAFPFLLAVARMLTIDAACIRSKVTRAGKAINRSRLQQDRRGQYPNNARNARKKIVLGGDFDGFLETFFKQINLRTQRSNHGNVGFDGQCHILWNRHLVNDFGRQTLHLIATDASTALARRDVFNRQNMQRPTAHQLHALSPQIALRALFPRQDRARR